MCIRIWGDLLRRLIDFPARRPARPQAPHPRTGAAFPREAPLFDDADAAHPTGAARPDAPHADRRTSRARSGAEAFSPAHLRVRFTQRAWVALLGETLYQVQSETGGILLGYRDGCDWLVVESIDPGPNSVFELAYFEYDQPYVNHLANRIVRLYERPLEVIGLWHRHPGSFDRFSATDDGTNARYAQLSPWGSLSGLVNIDPEPRLTLFHVDGRSRGYTRVPFTVLEWEESLAAAPLCAPDALARTIAVQNERALHGGAPAATEAAEPPLELAELARLWRAEVSRRAADGRAPEVAPHAVWDTSAWTDDELADAVALVEEGAAALAARGIELELSVDDERRLRLSAGDGQEKLALGIIGRTRDEGGGGAFVLHHPASGATVPLDADAVGSALGADRAPRTVHVTIA